MSEIRFCPNCGAPRYPQSRFCDQCGVPISTTEPSKKSGKPGVKSIVAIVVAVLLIVGGASAATVVLSRGEPAEVELPGSSSQMKSIIEPAEGFLSTGGRQLLGNKAENADIYAVSAKLDTENNEVSGDLELLFTNRCDRALDKLVLRVYANSDFVRGEGQAAASITNCTVDGAEAETRLDDSLFYIELPGPVGTIEPGKSALVTFSFREAIPQTGGVGLSGGDLEEGLGDLLGESGGGYGIYGHGEQIYNLGHFLPTVVSYDDKGWHQEKGATFGDIANFSRSYYRVSIDVPEDMVIAAPGVRLGEEKSGGRKVATYAAGPVNEFTFQASADYAVKSKKVGEVTVSSYFVKGSEAEGEKALQCGARALGEYSKHFGPYAYKSLNLCEAPMTGGAAGMEYPGQIQLAEMFYGDMGLGGLLPEEGGDLMEGFGDLFGLGDIFEFVIAHEVGHQWWCHGVASDSIRRPWMDESLTNYTAVLYFRWAHGEEAAEKQKNAQLILPYQSTAMFGGGDARVDQPVYDFNDQTQYTAVVYCKGALFFDELEKLMGRENFEKSLRDYYDEFVFREAHQSDLLEVFRKHAPDPEAVSALYRRWIEETHGDEDIGSSFELPGIEDTFEDLGTEDYMEDLDQLWDRFKEADPDELLDEMMKELEELLPPEEDEPEGGVPEQEPLPGTEPLPI